MAVNLSAISQAIRAAQTQIVWKPGKADEHLRKRKEREHISKRAELADYERIIQIVLHTPQAVVYVYHFGTKDYPTVVAPFEGRVWLVMFGLDGVLETAFPPDEPSTYFTPDSRYVFAGKLEELMG